jgi:hypothetical protein
MKSVRLLAALVAALVAGVFALTGCTTPSAGIAAEVDGTTITVRQLEDSLAGAEAAAEFDPAKLRPVALNYMIRAVIVRAAAAQRGLALSTQERSAFLAGQPLLTTLRADPRVARFVDDTVDVELLGAKLGDTVVTEVGRKARVLVNPRYGTWSVQEASLLGDTGSISLPAPNSTPPA